MVRRNFLMGKVALPEGPERNAAIDSVTETCGRSARSKCRAVVHDPLTRHFGQEAVCGRSLGALELY